MTKKSKKMHKYSKIAKRNDIHKAIAFGRRILVFGICLLLFPINLQKVYIVYSTYLCLADIVCTSVTLLTSHLATKPNG